MNIRNQPLAALLFAAGLYGCGHPGAAPELRSARLTVPGGTEILMILSTPLGSATSLLGDLVIGTTTLPVIVGDHTAIPAGSTIQGHVTAVDSETKRLELAFTEVTTPVGDSASMSSSLTNIAGTKGKPAGTKGKEVVIPAGTGLAITLDQPFTIDQRS